MNNENIEPPTTGIEDGMFVIYKNDFGGMVVFSRDEAALLYIELHKFLNTQSNDK